jgi:hypothetical protein
LHPKVARLGCTSAIGALDEVDQAKRGEIKMMTEEDFLKDLEKEGLL